jgi:hypothetical protein
MWFMDRADTFSLFITSTLSTLSVFSNTILSSNSIFVVVLRQNLLIAPLAVLLESHLKAVEESRSSKLGICTPSLEPIIRSTTIQAIIHVFMHGAVATFVLYCRLVPTGLIRLVSYYLLVSIHSS